VIRPTLRANHGQDKLWVIDRADCLGQAVSQRRELEVAQRTIQVAEVGSDVARAGFRPRVVAEGLLNDFQ
jgi:outer membrane protein TolC